MRLFINGKEREVSDVTNLKLLLKSLDFENSFMAVALNMECVPKHLYENVNLKENDSIEILSPMQGG